MQALLRNAAPETVAQISGGQLCCRHQRTLPMTQVHRTYHANGVSVGFVDDYELAGG